MIKNASQEPKVYFGLHMVEGTAEYRDQGREPYRIYLGEEVLRQMDKTFPGKPMYVDHVDEVDLENLEKEADGYVIESFFNKADGKHWAKFIIVSDRGHRAIGRGWRLSNAYVPKAFTTGGLCHGVEYEKEVTMGEYEHLAIVENPRYEESIILTPEKFKAYNLEKEAELFKVANSIKGDGKMGLNIFKRAKVENAADIENMSVTLPKSKVDKTLSECIEIADRFTNMNGYANGDHMVKVGEEEMSVNEMVEKYSKMKSDADEAELEKKKNAEEEEKRKENMSAEEKEAEAKKNAEKEGDKQKTKEKETDLATEKVESSNKNDDKEEKKKNEEAEKEKESKKNALYFDALKNAPNKPIKDEPVFEMAEEQIARGKSRYGSN